MFAMKNFRTYQLAIQFHHACEDAGFPHYLRDQMLRASASVVLNLAEGSAKPTEKDRQRFYHIALGSLRECQAGLDLARNKDEELSKLADHLGAGLYKLCKSGALAS